MERNPPDIGPAEAGPSVRQTGPLKLVARRAPARVVRVGLLGYGRVGQAVASLARSEAERLSDAGFEIQLTGALVRDVGKLRPGPILPVSDEPDDVFLDGADVVVEVLGGVEPARTLISRALDAGVPVVSANKTVVARHGRELRALAARRGTSFAFDAAVLAGVPFLGSLSRRPLVASARCIAGIVNGTSHFIVSSMTRGASFGAALEEAVARGYAEPDSSADISGRDAAEKLTILLHLAGESGVSVDDLPRLSLDVLDAPDMADAERLGGAIKPVALAELGSNGGAWVGPAFVTAHHRFAHVHGVTNVLQLTSRHGETVTFEGPGAGPDVTALTILDDVVETAINGRRLADRAAASIALPSVTTPASAYVGRNFSSAVFDPPPGEWFLRAAGAGPWRAQHVAEFLAARGVPALQLIASPRRFVAKTVRGDWAAIRDAVDAFTGVGASVVALPVLAENGDE